MKVTENKYFLWEDAWVFTALFSTTPDKSKIDLFNIISSGDILNHSIVSKNEIINALIKLQIRDIIFIKNRIVYYTENGKSIIANCNKIKGGMFSRVDITLKRLNSKRIKLPFISKYNKLLFITDTCYLNSYNKYIKIMDSIIISK